MRIEDFAFGLGAEQADEIGDSNFEGFSRRGRELTSGIVCRRTAGWRGLPLSVLACAVGKGRSGP